MERSQVKRVRVRREGERGERRRRGERERDLQFNRFSKEHIIISYNELGFRPQDVMSICKLAVSSKIGGDMIGQKVCVRASGCKCVCARARACLRTRARGFICPMYSRPYGYAYLYSNIRGIYLFYIIVLSILSLTTLTVQGLGWKSVFACTHNPMVVSGAWSFYFKYIPGKTDELAFITPHWITKGNVREE
jgi:hypothetical protein